MMLNLRRVNPETMTHEEYVAFNKHVNLLKAESNPDDPPTSLESTIKEIQNWKVFQHVDVQVWHLWQEGEVIAGFGCGIGFYDDNRHIIDGQINVLKEHRRKGIGTQLLNKVIEIAEAHQRTLWLSSTNSNVPAGYAFAEKLGANKGIETHENQLVLADVDKGMLRDWINEAKTKAADFELGLWLNEFPEEEIEAVANLLNVMNDAPRGDLQIEDWKVKPEYLREGETSMKAKGTERWMLYARHKSGELAGFTEVFWEAETSKILWQGGTGVIPKYRGYGLGKWLKAAMLQKVFAERPVVTHIRTGNADSNEYMLAINQKLGFKPHLAYAGWQIEIEKLKSYLKGKTT